MERLSPQDVKQRLTGSGEIALLDVREHGQYGDGHPFFAVPLPYSRLEAGAPRLLPCKSAPIVLLDNGDGVAEKAAARLAALGYRDVAILQGGAPAWSAAGYTLFEGVNVPSKAFGEMVEHARGTPNIDAAGLKAMHDRGENFVLLDGRTVAEYRKMNIPGGVCCPNAELGHRLATLVGDEDTPIVVNCAGRTRSIMGAQSLIDLGFSNPVRALENGTQGWMLAGFELEHGADRLYRQELGAAELAASRERAAKFIIRHGIPVIDAAILRQWQTDADRSLYLLDVRTAEEFALGHYPRAIHAPGGQLVQATDQWVATRGARIVLCDDTGLRAAITAHWLRQMGHAASVLDYDVTRPVDDPPIEEIGIVEDVLPKIDAAALHAMLGEGAVTLLDFNGSMAFRRGHIEGARWAIRPRLDRLDIARDRPVVLTTADWAVVEYAALDLKEIGCRSIHYLTGTEADWRAAGLDVIATPDDPADADCIDFLFFTHDRHSDNLDACRQYLAWEIALIGQMDEQEKGAFRIAV
jgi:rhodanese-related sulfurtransferase